MSCYPLSSLPQRELYLKVVLQGAKAEVIVNTMICTPLCDGQNSALCRGSREDLGITYVPLKLFGGHVGLLLALSTGLMLPYMHDGKLITGTINPGGVSVGDKASLLPWKAGVILLSSME